MGMLVLLSALSLLHGCRRAGLARAAAEEGRSRHHPMFHLGDKDQVGPSRPGSWNVYVGLRPGCADRFADLLPLAKILDGCRVEDSPIIFSGPTWCRYLFDEGNFLMVETPSFSYLRQSLVEGATIRTSAGWGFVWTNNRGVSSVVLREPGGAAMVIQAPRRLCSRDVLTRLALEASARMAGRQVRFAAP